jgi:hypothetical protein
MAPAVMEPTPRPAGGPEVAPSGVARRLGIVFLSVSAVAAASVTVAMTLFEPTTASSFLVMVAGGLVGFTGGFTAAGLRAPRRAERALPWATERDRAIDDEYLAGELRWRWRKAAEGAGISRGVRTPSGWTDSVPIVMRVQLRPFTMLTIRLREGQLLSDVVAVEKRLRELMGVNGTSIARLRADVVTIKLW